MPALFESIAGMPVDYETLYVGRWTQRLMVADAIAGGGCSSPATPPTS